MIGSLQASSQSLHFILSLRLYSSFITSRPGPFITLCLGYIEELGPCFKLFKGTILQKNYGKMTILWPFSHNSFVKFHGKNGGSNNMIMLHPNLCYNEDSYIYVMKLLYKN